MLGLGWALALIGASTLLDLVTTLANGSIDLALKDAEEHDETCESQDQLRRCVRTTNVPTSLVGVAHSCTREGRICPTRNGTSRSPDTINRGFTGLLPRPFSATLGPVEECARDAERYEQRGEKDEEHHRVGLRSGSHVREKRESDAHCDPFAALGRAVASGARPSDGERATCLSCPQPDCGKRAQDRHLPHAVFVRTRVRFCHLVTVGERDPARIEMRWNKGQDRAHDRVALRVLDPLNRELFGRGGIYLVSRDRVPIDGRRDRYSVERVAARRGSSRPHDTAVLSGRQIQAADRAYAGVDHNYAVDQAHSDAAVREVTLLRCSPDDEKQPDRQTAETCDDSHQRDQPMPRRRTPRMMPDLLTQDRHIPDSQVGGSGAVSR
jgi:hypothetical protein